MYMICVGDMLARVVAYCISDSPSPLVWGLGTGLVNNFWFIDQTLSFIYLIFVGVSPSLSPSLFPP